jgi:hypothetical protein
MVLYQDIKDHVNTNGIVSPVKSMRILEVLDSVCGEIDSSPNYGVDPSSFLFFDAYISTVYLWTTFIPVTSHLSVDALHCWVPAKYAPHYL